MNKRFKNIKVGLIVGLILLFITIAVNGWQGTLVKKSELYQNYSTDKEITEGFASKSDYNVLDERTKTISNQAFQLDEKLNLIMLHYNIAYNDLHRCPYPPCVVPKKKRKGSKYAKGK